MCAVNFEVISEDARIIYELGVTVRFIIPTNLFIISVFTVLSYDVR